MIYFFKHGSSWFSSWLFHIYTTNATYKASIALNFYCFATKPVNPWFIFQTVFFCANTQATKKKCNNSHKKINICISGIVGVPRYVNECTQCICSVPSLMKIIQHKKNGRHPVVHRTRLIYLSINPIDLWPLICQYIKLVYVSMRSIRSPSLSHVFVCLCSTSSLSLSLSFCLLIWG